MKRKNILSTDDSAENPHKVMYGNFSLNPHICKNMLQKSDILSPYFTKF